MKRQLTVVVKHGGNSPEELHHLKPKKALKKYREVKAEQKRVWPRVDITEFTNTKTGEAGEARVFEEDDFLAVFTPDRIYTQLGDNKIKTFKTNKGSGKKPKKKKK